MYICLYYIIIDSMNYNYDEFLSKNFYRALRCRAAEEILHIQLCKMLPGEVEMTGFFSKRMGDFFSKGGFLA